MLLDNLTKNLASVYLEKLSQQDQDTLIQCLEVLANEQKYNKFATYFPDEGQYKRELYPKHIEYFNAGKSYRERAFIAANRVGKSEAGSYEVTCHATGNYPEWWDGLRFNKPTLIWVGGDTGTTIRDIVQKKLLGEFGDLGSGMIPREAIVDKTPKRGIPDAIESVQIRHSSGGITTIVFKSYEQGRVTWQGTEVDYIWMDEEPPVEVYNEALIRLMTTGGSISLTYTPLQGLTELVENFLNNDQNSSAKFPKHVTKVAWRDVPHMTEEMKEQMLAATPPQMRLARSEGEPTVGSGLIYPISAENYTISDFQIPRHWMKLYGFDVGWNNTACCWGAWDKDNDVIYVFSEYKRGGEEGEDMPLVHASAIKSRGEWINGEIDPASRGRSQADGERLFMTYKKHGLKIHPADNAVESGIYAVWERLNSGRLKIFKSATMLLSEIRTYHRDEKGKIVKRNDHILDALRYMCMAPASRWSYPSSNREEKQKVVDISQYMRACI